MIGHILADQFRILGFRRPSPALGLHWRAYLAYGLVVTCLAGMGRYWDNPRASLFQHLGLGSLAYIFFLSALLWLMFLPFKPRHWRYRNILLFVSLCSLPALLYAIPVERFMPMASAQQANIWFLAVVATWRVALLAVFLRRVADLRPLAVVVATLLPIVFIVVALTLLNLEHVVFDLMAGIRPEDASPADAAYLFVMTLSYFSILALPFLAVAYFALVLRARRASASE